VNSFRVIWNHKALQQGIASIVLKLMEKGSAVSPINEAMLEIDVLLAKGPSECGESRGPFERVLIVLPLSVIYEVHEDERIVYISGVRYSAKRKR